jgi:hypothetical protein
LHDLQQAQDSDHGKPEQHQRSERDTEARAPAALRQEQSEQDRRRCRQHERLEHVVVCREALEGAQYRDRRRDHRVCIEQCRTGKPKSDENRAPTPLASTTVRDEGHQRENSALAAVVGTHHHGQILDRDDHDEGPKDE